MPDFECIADRFAVIDRVCAIDLATAESVRLVIAPAGSPEAQLQWARACDARCCTASAQAECLIDFGRHGESTRFEAWGASRPFHPERSAEKAIAELFEIAGARSRAICIFGPPGAGKSALL